MCAMGGKYSQWNLLVPLWDIDSDSALVVHSEEEGPFPTTGKWNIVTTMNETNGL